MSASNNQHVSITKSQHYPLFVAVLRLDNKPVVSAFGNTPAEAIDNLGVDDTKLVVVYQNEASDWLLEDAK